jgi:hypothetical protein
LGSSSTMRILVFGTSPRVGYVRPLDDATPS